MITAWLLFSSGAALADEPAPPAATLSPSPQRHWYGWQTVIVDGTSLVTGVAVSFAQPAHQYIGVPVGTAGLVLGGPIVHWAHGNVGKGFASFGIRGAGAGIGFGVGCAVALATQGSSSDDFRGLKAGLVGLPIGATVGAAIDIAVLAYGKPPAGRAASERFVAPFPLLDVRPGHAVLGLGGAF